MGGRKYKVSFVARAHADEAGQFEAPSTCEVTQPVYVCEHHIYLRVVLN